MFSVPDGGAHRADQGHDQQDAEQHQDLHVGHPLHVGTLQWRFGGVLGGRRVQGFNKCAESLSFFLPFYIYTQIQTLIYILKDPNALLTCISLESWPV